MSEPLCSLAGADTGGLAPLDPGADPLQSLAALRGVLLHLVPAQGPLARQASQLFSSAFEQIVEEHRGMVDELLSVYEQLGIIFEVTRKLPSVSSEEATIGLFVDSLRRSFAGRTVCVARLQERTGWSFHGTGAGPPVDRQIAMALDKVCRGPRARTLVVDLDMEEGGQSKPLRQVLIGPVYSGELLVCALVIIRNPETSTAPVFRASDMSLVEALATYCGDIIRNHRLVREMREMSVAMVRALVSAVDQKDRYTSGHTLRVGYFATTLGRLVGLPERDLQMLQWSALLHDVGKIGIRDAVLNKQGKLTAEEFAHIKEHPERSYRVVQQVPQLAKALDGILYHHERYDGGGYPAGLKGEAIPLQARIIQIADVFDALTSSRSYRPAYTWEEALSIMNDEAGTAVDPQLQKVFDRYIRQTMQAGAEAWESLVRRANEYTSTLATEDVSPDPTAGGGSCA